ncbi:helix-turn-helix domain-containing protein [Plantactinospora sp. WMMC1484]|uniref:helix-turn-helix domain-containing protein n=1 Tax=Plantactinospora sp. WMMC1484 TaxID=3404122 RepID=UPI003BF512E7
MHGEPMTFPCWQRFRSPVPATEMTEVSVERPSAAVIKALTDPAHDAAPDQLAAERSVLATFLDTLLGELPWWNRAWRVAEVGEVCKSSSARAMRPGRVQVVEVTVPGSLGGDAREIQTFSARVRLLEDRLLRWQMKVGDTVIGPAVAPAGELEPHPFGAVFQMLVEMRGLSRGEVALRTGRAQATIMKLRHGALVPERALIEELARALNVPAANLALIAGVDSADPGRA